MIRLHHRCLLVAVTCVSLAATTGKPPLDVPFFTQQKNGCGAASVAMVVGYWTKHSTAAARQIADASPERVYAKLYDAERRGILLSDMKHYLEESGFRAFTLRGRWSDLENHLSKGRPIIVGLKKARARQFHFAVVAGAAGNQVWINDPTRKKASRMKLTEFNRQWELADSWMLLATPS
jgi:predicted double-glycine peptidase